MPEKYSSAAWSQSFRLDTGDLDCLNNLFFESGKPLPLKALVIAVLQHRLDLETKRLQARRQQSRQVYQPKETYQVGQSLRFAHLGDQEGVVTAVRVGNNAQLPGLQVIEVQFANQQTQEFAANLPDHTLNDRPIDTTSEEMPLGTATDLYAAYGVNITAQVEAQLLANPSFLRLANRWFLRGLIVDVNVGQLNLAEALLDMSGGGPLQTLELAQELDFAPNLPAELVEFSLNYALMKDNRFDEVGPTGEVLWYLRRLEPDSVQQVPERLVVRHTTAVATEVVQRFWDIITALSDEYDELPTPVDAQEQAILVLPYHHLRCGTLPLAPAIENLFPRAWRSPRIRFTIVDVNANERLSGWVVREHRYISGLAPLYQRYGAIAGTLIGIARGKTAGEVFIKIGRRKPGAEWLPTLAVNAGKVFFTTHRQVVGVVTREEMGLVVQNPDELEQVWRQMIDRNLPFTPLIRHIFRELQRLTPQNTVHFNTLYSAVNTVWRTPAKPILLELLTQPYYEHVGDAHWRLSAKAND